MNTAKQTENHVLTEAQLKTVDGAAANEQQPVRAVAQPHIQRPGNFGHPAWTGLEDRG